MTISLDRSDGDERVVDRSPVADVKRYCASVWMKCRGVPGERSPPVPRVAAVLLSGITAFLGILAISLPQWYLPSDTNEGMHAWRHDNSAVS